MAGWSGSYQQIRNWFSHSLSRFNRGDQHAIFASWPPIATQQFARQANFLVLDLETTGLDAKTHHIVSAGWVCINQLKLDLSANFYRVVRPDAGAPRALGQSAVIHGLHQHDLASGCTEGELLTALQTAAAGRVLVCHHSAIERRFIQQACQRNYQQSTALAFVDTLALEHQQLQRQGRVIKSNDLSLNACLVRHGLPQIRAHNALEDAYGCALLLLHQIRRRDADLTVQTLLKPYSP